MSFSAWVSVFALAISIIALYFTFKKDAHRIRLKLNRGPYGTSDFISINNDSSFSVFISSVGHVPLDGEIEWMKKICDGKINESFDFPVKVDARSTYEGVLLGGYPSKIKILCLLCSAGLRKNLCSDQHYALQTLSKAKSSIASFLVKLRPNWV